MSSKWLMEHRADVRSQHGEDGVLDAIFNRIGPVHKTCVEFGAWDGEYMSNCWHLIHDHGWRGVMIEGDPKRFATLQARASSIGDLQAIQGFVRPSGEHSLNVLLKRAGLPPDFDLLSIDIDNDDYYVWESLTEFVPRVVVIEVNSEGMGPTTEKIARLGARTWSSRSGTSFSSMVALGKRKGYELAVHIGNCIFVRRELAPALDIDPNNWRELFDPGFLSGLSLRQRLRMAAGDLWHRRVSVQGAFQR